MISILFFGDVVGKLGRQAIEKYVPILKEQYNIDFVIANGENATHGKGLIKKHYQALLSYGVDAITLGNHYKSQREIYDYINEADRLIRPINLIGNKIGGNAVGIFECKGHKIRVLNVLGTVFMVEQVANTYQSINDVLFDDNGEKFITIIDMHCEATSEKISIGYLFDGKVSAVLGTHTHVQTNDARILKNGTAYITDVGMNGANNGVLGFEKNSVINKTFFGSTERFTLSDNDDIQVSAVVVRIDEETGKATEIIPIHIIDEK